MLYPVYSIQPVVKPGCTTGMTTALTTGCIRDTAGCQTGCQTGLTTGLMFVYTIQPVVKPVWELVWQPVWQPVVSCKRGFSKGLHSFTCHPYVYPYLPLLPSRRASPHFGWYSFPLLLPSRSQSTADGLLLWLPRRSGTPFWTTGVHLIPALTLLYDHWKSFCLHATIEHLSR